MSTLNGDGEFFSGLRDWGVWFISKMFEGLGVLLLNKFGNSFPVKIQFGFLQTQIRIKNL